MMLENMLAKKKRHQVNKRDGNSPGAGAGDSIFLLLFLIPIAIPYILAFLGIPFFIYFIYLLVTKDSSKSLPKVKAIQVTPEDEGNKPRL